MRNLLLLFFSLNSLAFADMHTELNNFKDNGISEQMNLTVFPALVVVEPKENTVIPVAFGLFSEDKIGENLEIQFQKKP